MRLILLFLLVTFGTSVKAETFSMRDCMLLPITDSAGNALGFKVYEALEAHLKSLTSPQWPQERGRQGGPQGLPCRRREPPPLRLPADQDARLPRHRAYLFGIEQMRPASRRVHRLRRPCAARYDANRRAGRIDCRRACDIPRSVGRVRSPPREP